MLKNLGGDIVIELGAAAPADRRNFSLVLILPSKAFIQAVVANPQAIPLRNTPGF